MTTAKIEVVGLGAGDLDQLPLGIYRKLTNIEKVFVRTKDHPVIASLEKEGIQFTSFDSQYEQHDDFQEVYQAIVQELVEEANNRAETIVYAVPGHPMLAEETVQLLLKEKDIHIDIIGGHSYLDAVFTALRIDPIEGFQFIDATAFQRDDLNFNNHLLFCQVYDQFSASEVKLTLLEDLPYDYPVTILEAAGTTKEKILQVPLEELDYMKEISNLTTVYVPPVPAEELNHQFFRLRDVVRKLRGPEGCPWDKKQTHESLRRYLIEESYELIDAIDEENDDEMIEELGDVLFQVMLHSQIGEDAGYFSIDDVIKGITDKMIGRHPHVFSDLQVESIDEINSNWEAIKSKEKQERTSILEGIPKSLPALLRSNQIQRKARRTGFQWDKVEDIWDKFDEEVAEFIEAVKENNKAEMEKEFGDILFVLVNIAIFYEINPEFALDLTNDKFVKRFTFIEKKLKELGKNPNTSTLEEMDAFWEEAKKKEKM